MHHIVYAIYGIPYKLKISGVLNKYLKYLKIFKALIHIFTI